MALWARTKGDDCLPGLTKAFASLPGPIVCEDFRGSQIIYVESPFA